MSYFKYYDRDGNILTDIWVLNSRLKAPSNHVIALLWQEYFDTHKGRLTNDI